VQRVLTVFELNEYVRKSLARDPMLKSIQIRGEISNMKSYPSGHWYFSLKDENARINCVMFRQHNFLIGKPPSDGESLVLTGNVSLYTKDGSFQFYVEDLKRDGIGELFIKFVELKNRLEAQGYFDPSIKKPLPPWPKKIGIITSVKGAVVHDIRTVSYNRNPAIPLVLYPVKVQGDGAAEEMIAAIHYFNEQRQVDVIILGRGGGSIEDLWAFNDERLAMAIVKSDIPIVSAVGHETDFTIADFVADIRAATPSQAAEMCVGDKKEWSGRLLEAAARMGGVLLMRVHEMESRVVELRERLLKARPDSALAAQEKRLLEAVRRMEQAANNTVYAHAQRFERLMGKLGALSPKAVLRRGYALAYRDGKVLTGIKNVRVKETLEIVFSDGVIDTTVNAIKKEG